MHNTADYGIFISRLSREAFDWRTFNRKAVQCFPFNLVDFWNWFHYIQRLVELHWYSYLQSSLLESFLLWPNLCIHVGPFTFTSNGWFGAWGGLISSMKWCIGLDFVAYDSQSKEVKHLMNLVLCSIVTILASIEPLRTKTPRFEGAGLSIAAGALTLIVCSYLITMYKDLAKDVMKVTTALLFVLWAITAGVCTYFGPFLVTGNGFFACWLAALCSLKIVMIEQEE